jgi:hypothetical protein
MIILKWTLKKQCVRKLTGLNWHRIGLAVGSREYDNETFGSIKGVEFIDQWRDCFITMILLKGII